MAGAIIDYIGNQVAFPQIDVRQRLSVSTGYGVAELVVQGDADLIGRKLGESGLRERDITVLTLHRGASVIPTPSDRRVLEAGDRLLCFGKLEEMRSMIPARKKRRARVKKLPKHPIHDG
ncbi:cation:proton antiporter regulatory subunit [Nocardioides speluncae]|uniref:cation:proton antiporter regulatory subunit n=1 Tax=Nocardioides speluncae TaxID=2670337 RepID=UPI003B82DAD9